MPDPTAATVTESISTSSIAIPWGVGESLALELPADWPEAEVVWPDLAGALGRADYPDALEQALETPVEARRIEDQVRPGSTVALVVDDPSRWTPVRAALPAIVRRLNAAGVRDEDIHVSVGVGRHQAVDADAMRRRVGPEMVHRFRCDSPPVDDRSCYEELGTTPQGVPVRVFRPVVAADLRILVGSVLPHLQAGFGGGFKLIFPGTSHRSTLAALHRTGLDGDAGRLLGTDPSTNPMRQAVRAAADLLPGPSFSISHVLGAPGEVLQVLAGHPEAVQTRLAAEARRRFQAPPAPPADLIVAGNAPWPGDPMQSFKVLLHHRAGGRPSGVLVGFFWTDPAEIDRSFPLPVLRAIAASGAPGGWVIRRSLALADRVASARNSPAAFMIRWARELVVDRTVLVYAPPLYQRLGPRLGPVRLFDDQASLWRAAARAVGPAAPRVRLFPQGGLTYCPQQRNPVESRPE